jgi:hypothetical protein
MAEYGILELKRKDYQHALQVFYTATDGFEYWGDVAHIAERVLTLDELKTFVDQYTVAVSQVDIDAAKKENNYFQRIPALELRAILARRLLRNQLLDEAWRKLTRWDAPQIDTLVMSESVANDILSKVGATAPVRDSVDTRIIADFAAETGAIKDNVVFPDDFPTFENLPAPVDSDNDGMADSWETTNGFNVGVDDSALDADADGYTNIEEYLHILAN